MAFVKDSGYFETLNKYLKVALWLDILGITVSFASPVFLLIKTCPLSTLCNAAVIFIISYTLFTNIRFSLIFIRLLSDPKK